MDDEHQHDHDGRGLVHRRIAKPIRNSRETKDPIFCARLGGSRWRVLPVVVLGFRLGALIPSCLGALALANPQALVRLQLEFMSEEKEIDSLRPAGVVAVSFALVVLFELWRR